MNDNIEFDFEDIEFADNPEPRCPVVLLLDRSESMRGEPIAQLNEGLQKFQAEITQDPIASSRVEVAIVTFGPVKVEDIKDGTDLDLRGDADSAFITVDNFTPPILTPFDETPMGEAVEVALELLRSRKEIYKRNGIDYFRPWLFLITDGYPTDRENFPRAWELVQEEVERKGVTFFGVGVERADMQVLAQFSNEREPIKLRGLDFGDLFTWLSASLSGIAESRPGEQIALPSVEWGEIDTSV